MGNITAGICLLCALLVTACGDDVENTVSPISGVPEKSLFSNWLLQDSSTTVAIDLSDTNFGSQAYYFFLTAGGSCDCLMNIAGTQSSGTILLASCTYDDMGTGLTDPGCAVLNGARTYTKTADTLTVCIGAQCGIYK